MVCCSYKSPRKSYMQFWTGIPCNPVVFYTAAKQVSLCLCLSQWSACIRPAATWEIIWGLLQNDRYKRDLHLTKVVRSSVFRLVRFSAIYRRIANDNHRNDFCSVCCLLVSLTTCISWRQNIEKKADIIVCHGSDTNMI